MVAESTSTLNESYVEPSPYAWLRSRAPVPTTYAPTCEPLYPFQEILENRTSRARGITGNCTEVVERKFSICIEIWQVELESCVWQVSFHKYAYVHGDPIQGIDPTGKFIGTVLGVAGGLFGGLSVRASKDSANLATGALIARVLLRVSLGYALGGVVAGAYFWDPITQQFRDNGLTWDQSIDPVPEDELFWMENATYVDAFKSNVKRSLIQSTVGKGATVRDMEAVEKIAHIYVNTIAGTGGTGGWWQSVTRSGPNCNEYCTLVATSLSSAVQGTNWVMREHFDSRKYGAGEHTLFNPVGPIATGDWNNSIVPLHSFVSLSFRPSKNPSNDKWSSPDWVLDPWQDGRPQIYKARTFHQIWPLNHGTNTDIDLR